jgi:hypothetical protein
MPVILQMTYMKKLGLPNFSSHSCAVSLSVEIPDVSVAAQRTGELYALLQTAVDGEIQHVGFMPDATTYGMNNGAHSNGHQTNGYQPRNGNGSNGNGNHRAAASASNNGDRWNMTDGQKGLILRVINENQLNKQDVEDQAHQLFGLGVKDLDKMQASQLIEELLEKVGKKPTGQRRWSRQPART